MSSISVARRLRSALPSGAGLPDGPWRKRHRGLVVLLLAHVPFLLIVATLRNQGIHGLGEALIPGVAALVASQRTLARRARGVVAALGLVVCSALLVHLSGGLIEMHFHFFVMIGLLTLYQDWVPFLLAIGFVALHHGIVGALDPTSVYNHPAAIANPWKWAGIHAIFVFAASIVSIGAWKINERAFITEREASDHLRSLGDMKDTFLAAVSHELRTPLTSVLGMAKTLDHSWDKIAPDEKRIFVERIYQNAHRLDTLLEDLLNLDRLARGTLEPRRHATDLYVLLIGVAREVEERGGRAIGVERCELVADIDAPKVERIVENLVMNAIKYTPAGGPIELRAWAEGAGVLIAVDDAGPGVPYEQRRAIFQPFQRGEQAISHAPGTGIGLSLVARFAELHSGNAWVEDGILGGASFRVYLPARITEAPTGVPSALTREDQVAL